MKTLVKILWWLVDAGRTMAVVLGCALGRAAGKLLWRR